MNGNYEQFSICFAKILSLLFEKIPLPTELNPYELAGAPDEIAALLEGNDVKGLSDDQRHLVEMYKGTVDWLLASNFIQSPYNNFYTLSSRGLEVMQKEIKLPGGTLKKSGDYTREAISGGAKTILNTVVVEIVKGLNLSGIG